MNNQTDEAAGPGQDCAQDRAQDRATGGAEEAAGPLLFHDAAIEAARRMARWVLGNVAEVRSVFVGFDYAGNLNEADVPAFLWLGRDGPVQKVDQVVGSIRQASKLTGVMVQRLRDVAEAYTNRLADIGQRLRKARDEQTADQTEPGPAGPGQEPPRQP